VHVDRTETAVHAVIGAAARGHAFEFDARHALDHGVFIEAVADDDVGIAAFGVL